MADYIVTDTETTGLHCAIGHRPFLGGAQHFDIVKGKAVLKKKQIWRPIQKKHAAVLQGPETKVLQNAKFDIRMLRAVGVDIKGPIDDTLLMAKLSPINFPKYELESMVKKLFDKGDEAKQSLKRWLSTENTKRRKAWRALNDTDLPEEMECTYQDVPADIMDPYFAADLENPAILYAYLRPYFYLTKGSEEMFDENRAAAYQRELRTMKQTIDMEENGYHIDRAYMEEAEQKLKVTAEKMLKVMRKKYGQIEGEDFQPTKDAHLTWLVIDKLKLKPVKLTPTKQPCFDEEALAAYSEPELDNILKYRKIEKRRKAYFEGILKLLDKKDSVHCSIWQLGARTGRYSISEPPLQQMPDDERSESWELSVRRGFIPRKDNIILCFDYSQIEPTIMALYSGDPNMMEAVNKGVDLHQFVADLAMIDRKSAKTIQLAKFYGKGRMTMIDDFIKLGKEDPDFVKDFKGQKIAAKYAELMALSYATGDRTHWRAAMDLLKPWWERSAAGKADSAYVRAFPSVEQFKRDVQSDGRARAKTREDGMGWIDTWSGRRLFASEREVYKLVNYLIQGTAADIMKDAIEKVDAVLPSWAKMLLTIHDELHIEAPLKKDWKGLAKKIKAAMEDFPTLGVPLRVDFEVIKKSWAEKEEIKL